MPNNESRRRKILACTATPPNKQKMYRPCWGWKANPLTDKPTVRLSPARYRDAMASGDYFETHGGCQQYAPTIQDELGRIARVSKAALTHGDIAANVGIGGAPGVECPIHVIQRAKARIKGWGEQRIRANPILQMPSPSQCLTR